MRLLTSARVLVRVGMLAVAGILASCSGEMSPTVTVQNTTADIARGVQVEVSGALLDIPPLRSSEKVRMPYVPAAGAEAEAEAVSVTWNGKVTRLDVHGGGVGAAINNIEILLTDEGVQLDE